MWHPCILVMMIDGKGGPREASAFPIAVTRQNLNHPSIIEREQKRMEKSSNLFEFHHQDVPTKVVKMKLPEPMLLETIDDLKRIQSIQRKIDEIISKQNVKGHIYHPFRLEFDPAALFVPSCIDFMHLNRELVKATFPEMHTCQCNAFTVPANGTPLGFHHATAIGYDAPRLAHRGWFMPEWHMSFHTALTKTNANTTPLVLFDDELPSMQDRGYLLTSFAHHLKNQTEPIWRRDLIDQARVAVIASITDLPFKDTCTLLQCAIAVYCAMQHCPSSNHQDAATTTTSLGTHWELEPGEALHFNNWRMHSDHGFGGGSLERHTLDLRCYSQMEIPFPFGNEHDFMVSVSPDRARLQDAVVDCLLQLLNHTSAADFYSYIGLFEEQPQPQQHPPLSHALGSILFNYINAGKDGLLSEELCPAMTKHAQRLRDLYNSDALNYRAFEQCVHQNEWILTKASQKDKLVPQSLTSRIQFIVLSGRLVLGDVLLLLVATVLSILSIIIAFQCITNLRAGFSKGKDTEKIHVD